MTPLPDDIIIEDEEMDNRLAAIRFYLNHLDDNDIKAVEALCLQLAQGSSSYIEWKHRDWEIPKMTKEDVTCPPQRINYK